MYQPLGILYNPSRQRWVSQQYTRLYVAPLGRLGKVGRRDESRLSVHDHCLGKEAGPLFGRLVERSRIIIQMEKLSPWPLLFSKISSKTLHDFVRGGQITVTARNIQA